ncbi:Ig-like domain-containing protein [Chryseobacterium gwangjuense]|uniref:Ig-like domain-containing protein n=1 Tax=Chryseobacterium gwangjuense TaxID=1069980 RepID=UPI001E37EF29|nr:Ig-like domain-containing protein [Chryseobacterium gwangjuense]MCE3074900.1 Ig-like domain-containing protein [Chryseobacterium gwangjuense]
MKKIFLLFVAAFLLHSCARLGSPIGGPKDSLAPKFLSSNIDTTRVNVSRDLKELRLDFDEYITLKDINKNLIISPPIKNIKRIIPSNIANKFLLIQWTDTLQANTTYNFNFGNSIADNNENNVLKYYNFAFSTGEKIDDLYISGEIKDALATKKSNGDNKMVVGLFQVKDTMNYRQKPYYITKVDDDGYYELNYLSPGKYKIVAFEDENGNSVYDKGKEKIGFQKEVVDVSKSISGLNMKVYPSKKTLKYLETKEMPGGVTMTFEGHPENVKILSLNDKLKGIKVTHTPKSDTAKVWFDAVKSDIGQTANENLKFSYDAGIKDSALTASLFYRYNTKNKMTISNGNALLAPKSDLVITSNYIIDTINPEKWTLKKDSLTTQEFTAKISETNPYQILVTSNFEPGKKYQLTVPSKTISSYYDKIADPYRFDFEADKVENYGSLTFRLTNAPVADYWIQLLDSSDKVVYQKYTKGDFVKFDILKPGEYITRILVDNNGNKYWDEADLDKDIFAEDSYVYFKQSVVRPLWDSNEDWDLKDTRTLDTPKNSTNKNGAPETKNSDLNRTNSSIIPSNSNKSIQSDRGILTPVK